MKRMTFPRTAALALGVFTALTLAACGGGQGQQPGSSGKLEPPETQTPAPDTTPEPDVTPTANPDEPFAYSEAAQAAIDDLFAHRQQEYFAAAALGYREEGDTTDFTAWLRNESPTLAAFWPFLTEIPEEDIIGDHGELFCVVPLDENIPLTVKSVKWKYEGNGATPHYSDPLYYGEVGKPFLLYSARENLWRDADVVVETVEEDGFVGTWSPDVREGVLTNPLAWPHRDGYVVLDFTHLYDVGDYIPRLDDGLDPDSEWLPPTNVGLGNTTWYSDNGWMLEFSYDESAGIGYGDMVLYQPVEGEQGTVLSPYYEGTWWMEDDSLCLGVYDGQCPFPLLISPSGEQMVIMQADDGSVLPFFEKGQSIVGLTFSYG